MKGNRIFYPATPAEADRLAEEYRYLGYHVTVEPGKVTVFAISPKTEKPKREKRAARKTIDTPPRP